jgi:hypothetical protein
MCSDVRDAQHRNGDAGPAPSGVQDSATGAGHPSLLRDVRYVEQRNWKEVRNAPPRDVQDGEHRNGEEVRNTPPRDVRDGLHRNEEEVRNAPPHCRDVRVGEEHSTSV